MTTVVETIDCDACGRKIINDGTDWPKRSVTCQGCRADGLKRILDRVFNAPDDENLLKAESAYWYFAFKTALALIQQEMGADYGNVNPDSDFAALFEMLEAPQFSGAREIMEKLDARDRGDH